MIPTGRPNHKFAPTVEAKVHTLDYEDDNAKDNLSSNKNQMVTTKSTTTQSQSSFETTEYIPFSTAITNLTELCSQFVTSKAMHECAQYSNLIIAFVVCIVFLATNLFMFSVIILHVFMKRIMLRKRRKQLESITNETIIDANKNNKHNKRSIRCESRESGLKTPSTLISASQSNITSHKRLSTATPYHQKHNICCMYDQCYKTDLTSFSKNSLHSRSRVIEKPKRSRSLGNKILSCLCGIACPDCENSTSKCHQHMKYGEVNEINYKRKFQPNPNELARAGYILQVPNSLHQQPDLGMKNFLNFINLI